MTNAEREDLLADLRQRRADESERLAPFEKLTEREREVLAGLMQGLAAEALANELFVSMATMRSHIRSILSKPGVRSQLAAVARSQASAWPPCTVGAQTSKTQFCGDPLGRPPPH